MTLPTRPQQSQRGSVLMLSIFMLIALFVTASAFLNLIPLEARAAQRSERLAMGSLVCDSGITEALAWVRHQLAPPSGASKEPMASSVYPSQAARTRVVGGGWSYRWHLIPDGETFPNGSNPIRAYTIVARAYFNGVAEREARAQVVQNGINKYAALYHLWPDNLVQPVRTTSAQIGGPVHTNGVMRLWIPEGAAFWTAPGEPPYTHGLTARGTFSSSPDGFAYFEGNWSGSDAAKRPYNNAGPIASRYNRITKEGREGMKAGAAEVPLPTNTFALRDAAWGFNTADPLPASAGVYLHKTDGSVNGVYIRGNVEEMELGVGGTQPAGPGAVNYGNNSWVKIELPISGQRRIDFHENYTVVTIKDSSVTLPAGTIVNGAPLGTSMTYSPIPKGDGTFTNPTLMRLPNGQFVYEATELNGVIYADGDIRNLWGLNKGRRTIGVSSDKTTGVQHDIIIGGREADTSATSEGAFSILSGQKGLIQFGATDANGDNILDAPLSSDNVLGLVADNVIISSKLKQGGRWDTTHPASNPLYLYATVMAGITDPEGSYKVDGFDSGNAGYAYQYGARIMNSAGAWGTTTGHGLTRGNVFFDEPASLNPPPYFPSIPSFALKSYEENFVHDGETL